MVCFSISRGLSPQDVLPRWLVRKRRMLPVQPLVIERVEQLDDMFVSRM